MAGAVREPRFAEAVYACRTTWTVVARVTIGELAGWVRFQAVVPPSRRGVRRQLPEGRPKHCCQGRAACLGGPDMSR
jgi:hypothetical protein